MRVSLILILILVLLAWYSLLGGVGFFSEVDLFSALSINLFVLSRSSRVFMAWVLIGGVLLDLVAARYLGVSMITNASAMFICILVDNFFKLFGEERKVVLVGLYSVVTTLIITFLANVSVGGGDLSIGELLFRLVFNLFTAFFGLGVLSKFENRSTIKV